MALETNAELLGRVPIFQGLRPAQLSTIAQNGREVYFERDMPILKEGEPGTSAYLILGGLALPGAFYLERFAGGILGYGTFLGELAMLTETHFTLTVTAGTSVRALAFDRWTMFEVMEADPAIARHFSNKLIRRLKHLAADLRRLDSGFTTWEYALDQAIARAS
jgi:CRP/FNR family transcriptional regulator, cyclic AMP receptor protein